MTEYELYIAGFLKNINMELHDYACAQIGIDLAKRSEFTMASCFLAYAVK